MCSAYHKVSPSGVGSGAKLGLGIINRCKVKLETESSDILKKMKPDVLFSTV